jgi:ribosomal-protein-alanine N-acetyltransferase
MLETKRLIIRPAVIEDAYNLYQLNSDPDVVRYTGDTSFKTLLDAQELIRDRMLTQFNLYKMSRFTVLLKDGTYLGWCGLKYFPETNEVDLGYRFMKKFWGQGYATEAGEACLKYGFEELKLKRIIAKAMPDNIGSIKVIQKLGFTFKGYVKDPTDPCPFILYELNNLN